jgi:acetyltransferase
MSIYRLDRLFAPGSIALFGASPRENSVGRNILKNLRKGGYDKPVHVVNPHYPEIEGIPTIKTIEQLPTATDLVVIAAPPSSVPDIVAAAGRKGCVAGIIVTAGLGHGPGSLAEATRLAAHTHGLRLVGPNCLGVLVPGVKLNASFGARTPLVGDLALISQSGAIVAGMIEWAAKRKIGFSAIFSMGDTIDVDFGDLLDFFALDGGTRAILLYIESITDAAKFMSAARAAARTKPVVVIKSGRHAQAAKASATHTGALAGTDAVYDAAFRRAGLLRVLDLDELFAAAETLGRIRPFTGNRLAILTNGGGMGVLAVDRLMDLGGTLAAISPDAMLRLDATLPPIWSKANPVDIASDAAAARYAAAFEVLLTDKANDAILIINVPTALASALDAARSVVTAAQRDRGRFVHSKPVFAVWVGEDDDASNAFDAAACQGIQSRLGGALHSDRLRKGHGLHRHRGLYRQNAGRCASSHQSQQ